MTTTTTVQADTAALYRHLGTRLSEDHRADDTAHLVARLAKLAGLSDSDRNALLRSLSHVITDAAGVSDTDDTLADDFIELARQMDA